MSEEINIDELVRRASGHAAKLLGAKLEAINVGLPTSALVETTSELLTFGLTEAIKAIRAEVQKVRVEGETFTITID